MIKVIGLTGGIACGKSTVSKTLIEEGIPVIDADVVARQVVEPGTIGLKAVIEKFGNGFLKDGQLDRPALGKFVFGNKKKLKYLEDILTPLIASEATSQFNKLQCLGHRLAVWDAALIVENGHADRYRPLIVVSCSQETQIKRLMKRNGLTHEQAMDRISSQLSTEEKVEVADYIINSEGSIEESIKQTKDIIQKLKDSFGF